MKRLPSASFLLAAFVAITPAKSAEMADPWTGFYAGGNIGYSWGNSDTVANFYNNTTGTLLYSVPASFDMNGVIGGGQIGYNKFVNSRWIVGIEADIQASGQDGGTSFICPGAICNLGQTAIPAASAPVSAAAFNQSLDWFGTVRGRLGVTVNPSTFAYVTGGLAFGKISTSGVLTGFTGGGVATSNGFSEDTTKAGWTIGGGIESRLNAQWSAKIEYLYIDFGSVSTTGYLLTNFIPIRAVFNSDVTDNIVRVGLNYKFK
jgi:outer membrane immunogenic protein